MNSEIRPFSIAIPIYNAKDTLVGLMDSLNEAGLVRACQDLVLIDDGSTDGTAQEVQGLSGRYPELSGKLKVVSHEKNLGRFRARLSGAQAASCDQILFIDSRVRFAEDFTKNLQSLSSEHRNWIPRLEIDPGRSIFCLYWKRSHEMIFRGHFRAINKGVIRLTSGNFGEYLKGTTVIFLSRETFIRVCQSFGEQEVLNDDYSLLAEYVKHEPIDILPTLSIFWTPRESWTGFLGRLWTRGPSFVEYHVVVRRDAFFWIVMSGLLLILMELALLIVRPDLGIQAGLLAFACAGLSTAVFARSVKEFFCLMPLHLAVICVFGSGILWGLVVNLLKPKMRNAK